MAPFPHTADRPVHVCLLPETAGAECSGLFSLYSGSFVVVRKNNFRSAVIEEAKILAAFLVEIERGKCGGDVDVAIHRASQRWAIEEGAIRSLRYRWRELHDIRASLLERLREAYEVTYERQRRLAEIEREIDRLTAEPTEPVQEELFA